jgi:hypothetical protein
MPTALDIAFAVFFNVVFLELFTVFFLCLIERLMRFQRG